MTRTLRRMCIAAAVAFTWPPVSAGHASASTASLASPGQAVVGGKETLTPAQQKINSQLLIEIRRRQAPKKAADRQTPPGPTSIRVDGRGRALVDVRVEVTPARERALRRLGATIVSTSAEYRSIIAWIPVLRLERVAEDPAVRAIEPKAEAFTSPAGGVQDSQVGVPR